MDDAGYEWDDAKEADNVRKHKVDFTQARRAFEDPRRLIRPDLLHSDLEQRYYCIGKVGPGVMTVRFTYRTGRVRIIGAGYWRKGRTLYEEANRIHE